tara:strand:- start:40 stop:693 length:654 start_codon:yes stop_codon:yes gene_type:complete
MTYPITIVDNFFEDPDAIVEMAMGMKYYNPNTGNWPGTRTKQLHVEDDRFFNYLGNRIHGLFFEKTPEYWNLQCHFQLIKPFCEDKYNKKNRGWIHQDHDSWFGGIVYLTKDPEPDTGTSIYETKAGWSFQVKQEIMMKEALYRSEPIDEKEYEEAYDRVHSQYEETVKIKNVYNRFVLFPGTTHHGVQTYGTKDRLTLNFFGMGQYGSLNPLMRMR